MNWRCPGCGIEEGYRHLRDCPALLAERFHVLYEKLAPSFGYETRKDTKVFGYESVNGRLMIEVCRRLKEDFDYMAKPYDKENAA